MYNSTGRIKSYVENAHVAVNSTFTDCWIFTEFSNMVIFNYFSFNFANNNRSSKTKKKKMLTIGARLLEVRRRFYVVDVVSLVSLLRHEKIQNSSKLFNT